MNLTEQIIEKITDYEVELVNLVDEGLITQEESDERLEEACRQEGTSLFDVMQAVNCPW